MRSTRNLWAVVSIAVVFMLTITSGWAREQKPKAKLPPAVAKAVMDNCPNAEIDKLSVEKEAGVTLYDIEFKAGRGEIEIAEDGSVIDIATVVKTRELPAAALAAIQNGAAGATIKLIEKSEVRAEVRNGRVVKLASPRYIFEAELVKGNQHAAIQVAPDGKVIEAPKWKN